MADNNEPKFEVNDKRRVNPDGTLRDEATEQVDTPVEEQPADAQASQQEEHVEMPPPNIYFELQMMALGLAQLAWQFMGIRLLPGQKEAVKDLAQAKIAIDTVAFIIEKLSPQLGDEDRKALQAMVSDLQINYVRHS